MLVIIRDRMKTAGLHIPSLDGLRAVSFGIVFAAHAGLGKLVPGGFGVTVFFFLSGFLITTLMRVEQAKSHSISLRNFYIRRALRILPPFYLILFAASAFTRAGLIEGNVEASGLLGQACHYANFWMIWHGAEGFAPGTGVYWSLAVEEHFYLLFPLLYVAMTHRRTTALQQFWTLLLLCAVVLAWRCVLVFDLASPTDRTYLASDTRFDSILFGCALAVYGNPVLDRTSHSEAFWKYGLLPVGLIALLLSFLVREPHFRETFRYSLQGCALVPVFVCAMRYPSAFWARFLNLRPVAFIGGLSYSLYLLHQVLLYAIGDRLRGTLGGFPAAVISLSVALGLAWLVHLLVEKPSAKLRRRFSA